MIELDMLEIIENLDENGFARIKRAETPIITVDCARGVDQSSALEMKYLVFPDWPGKQFKPIKCIWNISASPSSFIQIVIKELDLPCTGGNKLVLKEAGSTSKGICGKKPPPITSTANAMEFVLMLNAPGKHGARVQIGFMQKDGREGWTIAEFNSGKKGSSKKPSGRKGPKRPPIKLKSARKPPPKKPAPKKKKTFKEIKPYSADSVGAGYKSTVKEGDADRWAVKDRRPVLIGGGCAFLMLILGGAFYIGKMMQKDAVEQAKKSVEGSNKLPKFQIKDPIGIKSEESTETNVTTLSKEEEAKKS